MKEIAGKRYYTKLEVCDQLGVGIATLNKRICASKVDGYRIGRTKYYDDTQIQQLFEYKK